MVPALSESAVRRLVPLVLLSGCLFTADRVEPRAAGSLEARSAAEFFSLFQQAYETRSVGLLSRLLAEDYEFQADPASVSDPSMSSWGYDQELSRHQKMFQAISEVNLLVHVDAPEPSDAPAESTWHVSTLYMSLFIQDTFYEISGQADFRLRAVPTPEGGNRYRLVRWTDRN